MIEVNLMPRREGRSARGARTSPATSPQPPGSRWLLAASVPGLVGLLVLAFLHWGARDRHLALETRIADAVRDSTELAELILATEQLRARRDFVAAQVSTIQELDRGRYVWPHILDEVALALPEFTWLMRIAQVGPDLQIEGRAGNTFALTRYMNQLESSPFLHSVALVTTEQVAERLPAGGEWIVNSFVLQLTYQSRWEPADGYPLLSAGDEHAGPTEGQP